MLENLSIATAEVGEEKETRAGKAGDGADKPTPMRAIGKLPRVEGDQTHPQSRRACARGALLTYIHHHGNGLQMSCATDGRRSTSAGLKN